MYPINKLCKFGYWTGKYNSLRESELTIFTFINPEIGLYMYVMDEMFVTELIVIFQQIIYENVLVIIIDRYSLI